MEGGLAHCWGSGAFGSHGYPVAMGNIGDDEHPDSVDYLDFGGDNRIAMIATGGSSMCALKVKRERRKFRTCVSVSHWLHQFEMKSLSNMISF